MKLFFSVIFILSIVCFSACTKFDPVKHINCDGLVTDTVGKNDNGSILIPNAFTPNGDGLNEIYRPFTQNIDSIEFTIYDENNSVVFKTNLLGDGWTPPPTTLQIKRYYYKIQTITISHNKIGLCGDVYAISCFSTDPPKSFYYFEDMLTPGGFTGPTAEMLATCR